MSARETETPLEGAELEAELRRAASVTTGQLELMLAFLCAVQERYPRHRPANPAADPSYILNALQRAARLPEREWYEVLGVDPDAGNPT